MMVNVIGVDMGGTTIRAGLVSAGRLTRVTQVKTRSQATQQAVVEQISGLVETMDVRDLAGVGVGVPAIVDVDKGIVFETAQIPSWQRVPLKDILQTQLRVPVWVNNDANCFAMAEHVFGLGQGYRDIVAVTVGSGLGAGLILGGKLYAGHNCGAGEFGRMVYRDRRLTDYCSGKFFPREYGATGEELLQRAASGDITALAAFERFGHHFGKALSLIVHAIDRQIIILGGGVARAYDFFQASMLRSLEESIYERSFSRLQVRVSNLAESAVLGAAALCLQEC